MKKGHFMLNCPICQGYLEFLIEDSTNNIYISCDDCEIEFVSPNDVMSFANGSRLKFGKSRSATFEEISKAGWSRYIDWRI